MLFVLSPYDIAAGGGEEPHPYDHWRGGEG